MANPFVEYENIIMLLEPKDLVTTAAKSSYMSLKNSHRAGFLIPIGAFTSATVTDTLVITVEVATAEGGTEIAIPFRYRLSGALGANTWGAVTTCTSAGVTIDPAADDNKMVWIELEYGDILAEMTDATVARVVLTDTPDMEACLVTVLGISQSRYKQTTYTSSTASASS